MTLYLMEVPNGVDARGQEVCVPPPEYERLMVARELWQTLGTRYDEMETWEVAEAVTFLRLERAHPQRFRRKSGDN